MTYSIKSKYSIWNNIREQAVLIYNKTFVVACLLSPNDISKISQITGVR